MNASPTAAEPNSAPWSVLPRGPEEHVREVVLCVEGGRREREGGDRRREVRQPFPYLVDVTFVGEAELPIAPPLLVLGKQLSSHGFDFYHQGPLPSRRVLVTLPQGEGEFARLLLDVAWCRFIRQGWYESGGRFLRLVREDHGGMAPELRRAAS